MTTIDVMDAIEEIKTKIEELESGTKDAASCAAISDRLEGLRSQYREDPAAFEGHINALKELGGRFEAWLNDNVSLMVDWYHEILVAQEELNRQKAFLRNRFVMTAKRSRDAGDIIFEGKKDVLRVRPIHSRSLPSAGSHERKVLEEVITSAGGWAQVGQINLGRLQTAIKRRLFTDEQRSQIDRLCPQTIIYQVSRKNSAGIRE